MLLWIKNIAKELICKIFITCVHVLNERNYDLLKIVTDNRNYKINNTLMGRIRMMGEGTTFDGLVHISDPDYIIIGNNVHIRNNAFLDTSGGLTIGDNTYISNNVTIGTMNDTCRGCQSLCKEKRIHKPVIIGQDVWVGMNVTITPGVHIGEASVIGAGSVVVSDVPPFSISNMPELLHTGMGYSGLTKKLRNQELPCGEGGRELATHLPVQMNGFAKGENMFFVVSTGRSGSTSIANTLSQHREIHCYHEANRQLIRLSTEYFHKKITFSKVKEELRAVYCGCSVFPPEGVVGESNLKIGNLVEILSELLPKCKFIWIIRDGRSFVSSAKNRGWFSQSREELELRHQWATYRVNASQAGEVSETDWNKMDSFEKCCWYWNYWNTIIDEQLSKLDEGRYFSVRLEDLDDRMGQVQSFLGVQEQQLMVTKDNIAEKEVAHPYAQWSDSEIRFFEESCAEMMNKFYPSA